MNRIFFLFSLIVLGFSSLGLSQEPASGTYYIRSALGRYLDVQWGNPNNGTTMHLWDFNGGAAQKWHIKKETGGYFSIKSDLGRCLDVPNGKGDMGLLPQLWDCYTGLPQAWMIKRMDGGSWMIYSVAGTVLDVQNSNPAAGTPVWMYPFNGSAAQLWYLEPVQQTAQAVAKSGNIKGNFHIALSGIAMNECGSDRDCSHEPVAGFVSAYINFNGARVPRIDDNGTDLLWRSPEHTLQCFPMPQAPEHGYPRGYENEFLTTEDRHPSNVRSHTFTIPLRGDGRGGINLDAYMLEIRLNLGNPHKDNDFASTGYHWLTSQDSSVKHSISLQRLLQARGAGAGYDYYYYIGPFQTQSDRCHEYYIVFKTKYEPL